MNTLQNAVAARSVRQASCEGSAGRPGQARGHAGLATHGAAELEEQRHAGQAAPRPLPPLGAGRGIARPGCAPDLLTHDDNSSCVRGSARARRTDRCRRSGTRQYTVGSMARVSWACWWLLALVRARELDPAACGARFDVQRDKIIRTEESRDMGARYLSELEVGSRAECLRLCCETEQCDVFVYEEKSPGSCYLFRCGPPEDFRCKFTSHGNFSSGVLALARRLAELEDYTRHEAAPPPPPPPPRSTSPPTSPTPATTPRPAPPPPPLPPRAPPVTTPSSCSRYQFACRRGGECIAVYNACDGVPQCADGSDEAPELRCPEPPAPAPRVTQPPPVPESLELPVSAEERWPHRLTQAQPRYNEAEPSPHIFSHKGGLLQAAPPYEPAWPRRAWQPPPQAGGMSVEGEVPPWSSWEPRRAWSVPSAPRVPSVPDSQELPVYGAAMPQLGAYPPSPPHDSAKKGPPPPAPPEPPAAPAPPTPAPALPPPPPTENNTKKKALKDNPPQPATGAGSAGSAGAEAHSWGHPPEDAAPRASSAVLLLVLGVLMTVLLAGVGVSRARAARRRRRGRAPPDADYLVNGMYL